MYQEWHSMTADDMIEVPGVGLEGLSLMSCQRLSSMPGSRAAKEGLDGAVPGRLALYLT